MTLIEIIQHLAQFGKDHQKVGTEYFGTRENVDKTDSNGIVMWHYVDDSTFDEHTMEVRYNVSFMDVLLEDESNELDVLNDTFVLCESFLAYIDEVSQILGVDFQISSDGDITWFTHSEDSDYAGHGINITITTGAGRDNNLSNICDIPFPNTLTVSSSRNRIKKLAGVIDNFSSNHQQIGYSHFGRRVEMDFEPSNGQVFWYYLDDADYENGQVSISFRFVVASQINDDDSNESDVMSDALETIKDLHSYLSHYGNDGDYQLTSSGSLTPLNNVPSSDYYGWSAVMELSYGNQFDVEQIPFWQHLSDENGTFVIDEEGNRIQIL